MSKSTITKFTKAVEAYKKKHPNTSHISAQKKVSKQWKAKPVRRKPAKKKKVKRKVGRVSTVSKSHVDKNRFKNVDIQIGSVKQHLSAAKKALTRDYGKVQGQILTAKKAAQKKKLRKKSSSIVSQLRRLG